MKWNLKEFIDRIADIVYQPEISLKKILILKKMTKALKSDWEKVGNDTRNAMKEYSDY